MVRASRVVLLTGASGLLGSRFARALIEAGHQVICAGRNGRTPLPGLQCIRADFERDLTPQAWLPKLVGIDVVVNAVGIIHERDGATFANVHSRAPRAL